MNIFHALGETARRWQLGMQRINRGRQATTMLELFRPQLRDTPRSLRRIAEPVLAAVGVVLLGLLGALGVFSFGLFVFACATMYAILTQIFGIELGLHLPRTQA